MSVQSRNQDCSKECSSVHLNALLGAIAQLDASSQSHKLSGVPDLSRIQSTGTNRRTVSMTIHAEPCNVSPILATHHLLN